MFELQHVQPLFTCRLHLDFNRQLMPNVSSWLFPFKHSSPPMVFPSSTHGSSILPRAQVQNLRITLSSYIQFSNKSDGLSLRNISSILLLLNTSWLPPRSWPPPSGAGIITGVSWLPLLLPSLKAVLPVWAFKNISQIFFIPLSEPSNCPMWLGKSCSSVTYSALCGLGITLT